MGDRFLSKYSKMNIFVIPDPFAAEAGLIGILNLKNRGQIIGRKTITTYILLTANYITPN